MVRTLRKTDSSIHVNYVNGGYSTLHARDTTLDASEDRLFVSVDLSPNQRVRNKDSHCYLDISELIQNLDGVQCFEMYPEAWLKPLADSVQENPNASHEFEIRFKDGLSHKYEGQFKRPTSNVLFVVQPRN